MSPEATESLGTLATKKVELVREIHTDLSDEPQTKEMDLPQSAKRRADTSRRAIDSAVAEMRRHFHRSPGPVRPPNL